MRQENGTAWSVAITITTATTASTAARLIAWTSPRCCLGA